MSVGAISEDADQATDPLLGLCEPALEVRRWVGHRVRRQRGEEPLREMITVAGRLSVGGLLSCR